MSAIGNVGKRRALFSAYLEGKKSPPKKLILKWKLGFKKKVDFLKYLFQISSP